MAQFTLSQATQAAINKAVSEGPGPSNAFYVAAYNAIYSDIVRNGGVNVATQNWFSQAGNVNGQAFVPTVAGSYIWAYTQAAAASEGYTVSAANLQAASNAIAVEVFSTLQNDKFVFSDANLSGDFGTQQIIMDDAGAGIKYLKTLYPTLDYAAWGGTLFAKGELNDPTYTGDYGISISTGSRDSFAIVSGFLGGASAVWKQFGSSAFTQGGFQGITNIDFLSTLVPALGAVSSLPSNIGSILNWNYLSAPLAPSNLSSLSTNTIYVFDSQTDTAFTLQGNASGGGDAISFNPSTDTAQITNFVANSGVSMPAGSRVTGYTNGTATDTIASIGGGLVASVPMTVTNYGTITDSSGYGIWLVASGTVTNGSASDTAATITSANSAAITIQGAQGPSAVTNFGSISGTSGVFDTSTSALTVTNSGSIKASIGGGISGDTGIATNLGTVSGFNGVYLGAGGTVTNGSATDTTASITGSNLSITIGTGSLANYAKITGNIQMAGTVTNGSASDIGASIAGGITATSVTMATNFGSITGGIAMVAAGGNTVTNGSNTDTTALISGTVGISTAGGPASTINNFGSIIGTYAEGIRAGGTANITNGSTSDTKALIQGGTQGWGIVLNAGSVANYGTVKGGLGCISLGSGTITNAGVLASATPTGTAIQFGSGTNKLIEKAGATVSGTIFGSSGSSLELANDGTPVTMAPNISGVGTLIVDPGTTLTVAANASVPNIVNNGIVAIASGAALDVSSAVDPSSSGIFQLMTKGSLELGAILGSALKIQFLGSSPTNELTIDNASKFGTNVGSASYAGPLLENFTAGGVVDVRGIGSTGLALNYSATSGDLQITSASGAALATLAFQNSTLGSGTFHAAADPFGGALITHS